MKTKNQISNRKLQSYRKAEEVAREVRYQFAEHGQVFDRRKLYILISEWMNTTGMIKYERPKQ